MLPYTSDIKNPDQKEIPVFLRDTVDQVCTTYMVKHYSKKSKSTITMNSDVGTSRNAVVEK
jgi:hypothetical protein